MRQLLRKHFKWFSEKMDKDAVDSYAAHSSFWILIALIPFILFILTLMQTIRFEESTLLFAFADLMPKPVSELFRFLFSEMQPPSGLLSMTAIICVWSASNGMLALVKGLYAVFDVSRKRSFIRMRILAIFYTLAFSIVLLVSLGVFIFGDMLFNWLRGYLSHSLLELISNLKPILGFAVLILFFWLMFIVIPRKQVCFRNALAGAAFSAAGWLLFSFFFSIFVENFSNYATIYGSLAAIVILMMWLYFCMYILLIGGEVAMWLQHSTVRADLRTLYSAARRHAAAQKGRTHGKSKSKK